MLYLISTQKNQKDIIQNSNTGSIFVENKISDESKISNLKISGEDKVLNISEKNLKEDKSDWIIASIKSFFESDDDKEEELINKEKLNNKKELGNNEELTKNISKKIDQEKNPLSETIKWVKLDKEKIQNFNKDKIREIWVKSVFLNNAYFTKRLYTVYNWDKVKQLTKTNKYWCFKVKVVSSKNKLALDKEAWTCDYYMKDKKSNIEKYKKVAKNYYKNLKFKINSIHKVWVSALKLNNSNFSKKLGVVYFGDKLQQLTKINKYWCFKVKVISSKNIINNWKIAWACSKYLK